MLFLIVFIKRTNLLLLSLIFRFYWNVLGHIEGVKRVENLQKQEEIIKSTLKTIKSRIKDAEVLRISLEKRLNSYYKQVRRLKSLLDRINVEKEHTKIDSNKHGKTTDSLILKESKGKSNVQCSSRIIDVRERKYGNVKESLKKNGGNDKYDRVERRVMNSVNSKSHSTMYTKDTDHIAKKKDWKKSKKRVFERSFNMMDNVTIRNKEKNVSFMNRSPFDKSIGDRNSVRSSSFHEMDSVITNASSHKSGTTSGFNSRTELREGGIVFSYSAPVSQSSENLSSRSSIDSTNDKSIKRSKDVFQFESDDDELIIKAKKAKFKVKPNKLKLPSAHDNTNFSHDATSNLVGWRSPRVQLTDIAPSMFGGGITVYSPYRSPIASLKNKLNLLSNRDETETARRNVGADKITSQEEDTTDKDDVSDNVKDSVEDKTRQFDVKAKVETVRKIEKTTSKRLLMGEGIKGCFDNAENGGYSFENEHENSSDLLFDVGRTKKSRSNIEISAMKQQSVRESMIKGVHYPKCLEEPGMASVVTIGSFTGSKSKITSKVSQFEKQASCSLMEPIRSEAEIGMQDKDTVRGAGTAKEMSVVKAVSTENETASSEKVKKQVPISGEMLLIRTQEPGEKDTTVFKEGSSRKPSEGGINSLPLSVGSRNEKRTILMSHTSDSELSSTTNKNKEGTPPSSSLIMEKDVWKEASSRLKALINETVKRNGNRSGQKSCSESVNSPVVVVSHGNLELLRHGLKRSELDRGSMPPSLHYRKLFESAIIWFSHPNLLCLFFHQSIKCFTSKSIYHK